MKHASTLIAVLLTACFPQGALGQLATASETQSVAESASSLATQSYYVDKIGGGIWRRCDLGKRATSTGQCVGEAVIATWPDAVLIVNELNAKAFEGFNDWRLPSRRDLRNLLLNRTGLREPIGTNFYKYGFAPADLNAVYEDGTRVNFGGRYPGDRSNQCQLASDFIFELFGRPNDLSVDYSSIVSYNTPVNHRWLSNNERWNDNGRVPPEANDFQNPITINFASRCDYIVAAFFRSDKSFNLSGTLRSHAAIPILLVRGGSPDRSWIEAQSAVQRKDEVIAQSQRNAAAQNAAIAAFWTRIGNAVKETLANANSGPGPSAGQSSAGKTWLCQIQCRGPLFKLGSRPRLPSIGATSSDAAENVKDAAHKICIPEPGISWAEVVRCE